LISAIFQSFPRLGEEKPAQRRGEDRADRSYRRDWADRSQGRRAAELLGYNAVAAARSTGVDIVTGAGLEDILEKADVVFDASSPGYADAHEMCRFFETAGVNMAAAACRAGVGKVVGLSAVGAGDIPSGYFAAKLVQEAILISSGRPFTIVRSARSTSISTTSWRLWTLAGKATSSASLRSGHGVLLTNRQSLPPAREQEHGSSPQGRAAFRSRAAIETVHTVSFED
jgi:hypothetical protein